MTELFGPTAERHGERAALIDADGHHHVGGVGRSRQSIDQRAAATRGIGDDSTIAIMVGNRREFFEFFAAAVNANWVVVPVNWHWVADELAYVIENSGAVALIVDEQFLPVAEAARGDLRTSHCEHWILVGDARTEPHRGSGPVRGVVADGSAEEPQGQGTGGPMFYTSGTTGFPKGVRSALSRTGQPVGMWSLIAPSFCDMLGFLPTA